MANRCSLPSPLRLALATTVAAGLLPVLHAAKKIDPDPDLFDGTRTKSEEAIEEQQQPVVDDWEKGNLVIYDTDEQGANQGGQGTLEGQGPGME
ncbi:MAG: hypothetical protein D6781_11140, partial [Verrucomicrobia bacterium]